mmetsp:Transcript_7271/g.10401  ORF Transcript_7271/g.10401 Transcript_7271/m.10401 type:complete len:263 (+) Transcript_7271:3-791(+)
MISHHPDSHLSTQPIFFHSPSACASWGTCGVLTAVGNTKPEKHRFPLFLVAILFVILNLFQNTNSTLGTIGAAFFGWAYAGLGWANRHFLLLTGITTTRKRRRTAGAGAGSNSDDDDDDGSDNDSGAGSDNDDGSDFDDNNGKTKIGDIPTALSSSTARNNKNKKRKTKNKCTRTTTLRFLSFLAILKLWIIPVLIVAYREPGPSLAMVERTSATTTSTTQTHHKPHPLLLPDRQHRQYRLLRQQPKQQILVPVPIQVIQQL